MSPSNKTVQLIIPCRIDTLTGANDLTQETRHEERDRVNAITESFELNYFETMFYSRQVHIAQRL